MTDPTEHGRQLARHLASLVPDRPRVQRSRWQDHVVDVLVADGAPDPGVTTAATVSLSVTSSTPYGVELVTAYYTGTEGCLDAFLDAGFFHLEHGAELVPGNVLPDLISRRQVSDAMKHFFLIAPFLYDDALKSVLVGDREVRYLLAVPISDQEMALVGTEGPDALDDLFEREQIDIFDWRRASVVAD